MVSKFSILLYHLLPAGLLQSGKLQTASTEFTHRPKISIFFSAAATHCTNSREIWHSRAKFHMNWCPGVGTRPQNGKNFHFLVKSCPAGANTFTNCLTCVRGFYMPNYPALVFYILHNSLPWLRRLRISHLPRIFRAPCMKNYALDRKTIDTF